MTRIARNAGYLNPTPQLLAEMWVFAGKPISANDYDWKKFNRDWFKQREGEPTNGSNTSTMQ